MKSARAWSLVALVLSLVLLVWMFRESPVGETRQERENLPSATLDPEPSTAREPWMIPYGDEFWRPHSDPAGEETSIAQGGVGGSERELNLGNLMERTGNAFRVREGDKAPTARTYTHRTVLTEEGIRFFPYQPAREQADQVAAAHDSADLTELASRLDERPSFDPDLSMEWTLESVSLGENRTSLVGDWKTDGNTAQRIVDLGDATIVEHVESRDSGVERTWILPTRPKRSAELTIETRVHGLEYHSDTNGDLHFASTDGLPRAKIAAPVLVDAGGTRRALEAVRTSVGIRYTVPSDLLRESEYPLAVDPLLGSEFDVNTPVLVAAPGSQDYPDSARKFGSGSVLVWEDSRRNGVSAIFATRITSSGEVSDNIGIDVGEGYRPRIDCDADSYECYIVYYSRPSSRYVVVGRSFNASTGSLGSVKTFSDTNNNSYRPDVAHVASGWLVGWHSYENGSHNVKTRRVYDWGSLGATYTVDGSSGTQREVRLSGGLGGSPVATWIDQNASPDRVATAVLDSAGQRKSPIYDTHYNSAYAGSQPDIAVSRGGSRALVVWRETSGSATYLRCKQYLIFATYLGLERDCNTYLEYENTLSSGLYTPAVSMRTSSSPGWVVAWRRDAGSTEHIRARYVVESNHGTPTAQTLHTVHTENGTLYAPTISCGSGSYCYVGWYQSGALGDLDVYVRRTDSSGSPFSSEFPVTMGHRDQNRPRMASDAERLNGYITWIDYRSGDDELYGTGLSLGSDPAPYGTAKLIESAPVIYSHDVEHSLSWMFTVTFGTYTGAAYHVGARFVTKSGGVGSSYAIDTPETAPSAVRLARATTSGDAVVVWRDKVAGKTGLKARTVDWLGDPASSNVFSVPASGTLYYHDVVGGADPSNVLLVYNEYISSAYRIRSALLTVPPTGDRTPALSATETLPLASSQSVPVHAATNGEEYLVGWTTYPSPSATVHRVSSNGSAVGDAIFIGSAYYRGLEFVASDGDGYLLGYAAPDKSLLGHFLYPSGDSCGVEATIVPGSATRSYLESTAVAIDDGKYLVAYDRQTTTPSEGNSVLSARWVSEAEAGDLDKDNDGITVCGGDQCDNTPGISSPTSEIVADGTDQNCDGFDLCWYDPDDDGIGSDSYYTDTNMDCTDGSAPTADVTGDNCPDTENPSQSDVDSDGRYDRKSCLELS